MLLLLFGAQPTGTIYYVIGPSSGWADPTVAEIKLGQLSGGGSATASGNETSPTVTTAPFTFASDATGLTAATAYRIAFVWSNGTSSSNVNVSAEWTTLSSGASKAIYARQLGRVIGRGM